MNTTPKTKNVSKSDRLKIASSRSLDAGNKIPAVLPPNAKSTTVVNAKGKKNVVAYTNIIDANNTAPEISGLRYTLDGTMLGRLECLAKSRFEFSKIIGDENFSAIDLPQEVRTVLAKSVNCSSAIEGEQIKAKNVPIVLNSKIADDELPQHLAPEEVTRANAMRTIYKAFLWALKRTDREIVTYEFILELHSRMFQGVFLRAGLIKNDEVIITDEENMPKPKYRILTLPCVKTERYLKALIIRFNKSWVDAEKTHSASLFLLCAEFVIDFLAIHPFADGNGRTARLLSTYLLERAGYHFSRFYPVEQIIMEKRDKYYAALHTAQKNWYSREEDLTPWVKFYVYAVYIQYTRAVQELRDRGAL